MLFDTVADRVQMRRRSEAVTTAIHRMLHENLATLDRYQSELNAMSLTARADTAENANLRAQVARLEAANNRLRHRPRQPTCGNCDEYGHRATQCPLPRD